MAKKRMFNIDIVGSDAFLDMAPESQALYLQLSMRADDDGFIGNPKTVVRIAGVSNAAFISIHVLREEDDSKSTQKTCASFAQKVQSFPRRAV